MPESERLRERAAQLFALARKASEEGKPELAAEITRLAVEARDQADEMDRELHFRHEQRQHEEPQQPQQQQQQQPPSRTEKKD